MFLPNIFKSEKSKFLISEPWFALAGEYSSAVPMS